MLEWYAWLSQLNIPVLTALLLGLLGSRYLRHIAGTIFLVAGQHDTLTYWAF
jgi:hypothetical protein